MSLLLCLPFSLLSFHGVGAASSSPNLCLFQGAAASLSGKDLSEPGLGFSLSAVFATSIVSLAFIHDCAVILF